MQQQHSRIPCKSILGGAAFLLRLITFLLALAVVCCGVLALSSSARYRNFFTELTNSQQYDRSATSEIRPHISAVSQADSATRLIVGDSVCWQVFNPFNVCNDDYAIHGTNRAVTMSGQYLLIDQFLQAHPNATEVYLVTGPELFSSYFDVEYGYQYAVIPYAESNLLSRLDSATRQEMAMAYGAPFLCTPVVRVIDWSPLCRKVYLNLLLALPHQTQGVPLSPLSQRMIEAMRTRCAEQGVAFHLLAAPLADTPVRRDAMAALQQAVAEAGLADDPLYAAYFDSVMLYPAQDFNDDGIHFDSNIYTIDNFTAVLHAYQEKTGLFEGLVTSYH